MNSLLQYLQLVQANAGRPDPSFEGILLEGHGAPGDTTPPGFLFYADLDAGAVYVNASRVAGELRPSSRTWVQIADGSLLTTDQKFLTATI